MAKTYHQIYIHYIFSTKNRHPLIQPEFENRLYKYISGIGHEQGFPILAAGGMGDHLHLLISLSPVVSVSKTIQTIKGSSSKWINDCFYPEQRQFKWQTGYGAFGVSRMGVNKVKEYIDNQKTHHERMTFREEYRRFLKKYGVSWDERYAW